MPRHTRGHPARGSCASDDAQPTVEVSGQHRALPLRSARTVPASRSTALCPARAADSAAALQPTTESRQRQGWDEAAAHRAAPSHQRLPPQPGSSPSEQRPAPFGMGRVRKLGLPRRSRRQPLADHAQSPGHRQQLRGRAADVHPADRIRPACCSAAPRDAGQSNNLPKRSEMPQDSARHASTEPARAQHEPGVQPSGPGQGTPDTTKKRGSDREAQEETRLRSGQRRGLARF